MSDLIEFAKAAAAIGLSVAFLWLVIRTGEPTKPPKRDRDE